MLAEGKNGNPLQFITDTGCRLLLIATLLLITVPVNDTPVKEQFVVVIDAGHGGKDSGAVGSNSLEKNIVLAIALKTGKYIKESFPDTRIVYTREKDVFVDLDKRADIANKSNADLFISIHTNAVRSGVSRSVAGSETYVLGHDKENQNLSVVMKENEVIQLEENYNTKYEGYDPKSPESFIMFSLMQNIYLKQSVEFATLIQNQFRERAGRVDRGVKQGPFLVLWMTTMPSVLIETGFISNTAEEKFLNSEQGRDYIASAIFRAFREYKTNIDRKSSFSAVRADTAKTVKEEEKSGQEPESVIFTVQIASSGDLRELTGSNFKGLTSLSVFSQSGRYRYTSGKFTTYQEAVEYRKKIADKYPDAFVIAFKGSDIVPLQQALDRSIKK